MPLAFTQEDFLAGLPRVREMSGKNKIFSRSGKSQGILAIWPMSGNCQGILWRHVRELSGNFVMTLFLDWNFHHMIRTVPRLCLCECLLGKYKPKLLIIAVKLLPLKNPGVLRELPLIAVKSCLLTDWEIKEIVRENCYFVREMSWKCQGILNGLKCGNPVLFPYIFISSGSRVLRVKETSSHCTAPWVLSLVWICRNPPMPMLHTELEVEIVCPSCLGVSLVTHLTEEN